MSAAQEIAQHLPYLRRFARALSGSQRSGDAYVASTLRALVADPSALSSRLDVRLGLYRLFIRLWTSVPLNVAPTIEFEILPGQRNLDRLAPRSRQAFLLRTVEGFSLQEVATILDTDLDTVGELLDEAGREIALQMATDVLIIEDEPVIALDLETLVTDLGHRVTGIARTHRQAVKLAREKPPGLVLADIQLADGSSGLDAVQEILESLRLPVIFVTAFPERLLTGERLEPAFLISKPFQIDVLKATISQALFFDQAAESYAA
ncbi:response regulator [Labrys monachus]|uniref:DNA-directed RNA polymerase specialized sigma24 family protein n=1 Tax=Labrys monachus TaxID=217067 RepID=A0ABU0FN01_9HYPH|nr:response regulator [Labrys monachus]MDQ0395994.1 DNA-directed RNA polymerase specialized sigma24 family protein [Labrys monachus]